MDTEEQSWDIRAILCRLGELSESISDVDEVEFETLNRCLKAQLELTTSLDLRLDEEVVASSPSRSLGDAEILVLTRALEEVDVTAIEGVDLEGNRLGTECFVAFTRLLASGAFSALKRLNLHLPDLPSDGRHAVCEMLRMGRLSGLHQLDLPDCDVDSIVQAIEAGQVWGLRHLSLGGEDDCLTESVMLGLLFDGSRFLFLKSFTLVNCTIGDDGMTMIAESIKAGKLAAGLDQLTLCACPFGKRGSIALGATILAGCLSKLTRLCLQTCEIGAEGMIAIAKGIQSSPMSALTHLDLSFNSIGNEGAVALATAIQQGHLPRLDALHLDGCSIHESGIEALVTAIEFPGQYFTYDFNPSTSLPQFLRMKSGDRLKELTLNGNKFGQGGSGLLARIFRAGHVPCLRKLGVSDCGIGGNGVVTLFEALVVGNMVQLESLDLSFNGVNSKVQPSGAISRITDILNSGAFPSLVSISIADLC